MVVLALSACPPPVASCLHADAYPPRAEEVQFLTEALRAAREHRAQWLAQLQDCPCIDKTHLSALKAKAVHAPPEPTLQDVVDDHPAGPFGADVEDEVPGAAGQPAVAAEDDVQDEEGAAVAAAVAAAAAVGDVNGDAADDGDLVLDDIEAELELEEAAAVQAAAAPVVTPQSTGAAWPVEMDAGGSRQVYEPVGGIGRTLAAGGESVEIDLSHRASLALITSRQAHVHLLTVDPATGKSVIPYPEGMRIPRAHPEFQVDLVSLAHADGTAVVRDVKAVLAGTVPEIPARFQKMAPAVKDELGDLQMCIVGGCARRTVLTKMLKQHHLCGEHVDSDLRIVGTDQCVRRCTRCHNLLRVEDFRVGEGSETVGGCCRRCCEAQSKARKGATTATKPGSGAQAKARNGARTADKPVSDILPREEANGRDDDGSYRRERREAAMRLAQTGESMANPFIVWAALDPRRGDKTRCSRIDCPNLRRGGRDAATLCSPCYQVLPSPPVPHVANIV